MKRILIIGIIFYSGILFAQDMRQNSFSSLFSDQKAAHVGDAITILVVESSQASNDAETSAGRTSSLGLSGQANVGNAAGQGGSVSLGTNNDFKGSGSTKTTGMIQTKISATVDSVLQNGNMIIKGSRKISINGEEQTIFIKGLVRASDIMPDNSIMSYNIAEAEITFKGDGMINKVQSPGWLTKFFHWIF